MKLIEAHVTNFKSVEDSTPFRIDDITALVGKNESGKTSILQSLYKLHPVDENEKFQRNREYPRRNLNEYDKLHSSAPATVISTKWELDSDDMAIIRGLVGPDAITGNVIVVKKAYENSKGEQKQTWDVPVDEAKAMEYLRNNTGLSEQEVAALAATGAAPASIKQLREQLGKIPQPTAGIAGLIARLDKDYKRQGFQLACIDALDLPKFVYFDNYDRLPGRINIDQLAAKVAAQQPRTRGEEIALAFLGLAQLTLADVQQAKVTEDLIAKLEAVSNRITKMIFKYWTQNRHLRIQVRADTALPQDPPEYRAGKILSIRIYNTHHEVSVPFDERSAGFVWFFSFLVYFWQIEEKFGDNLVLLLDEPGLSLHARAQGDLLRYFRQELLPKQVVYSTHSPFMIPADNVLCARTVEDVVIEHRDEDGVIDNIEVLGTKVNGDVLSIDRDTLFPLQGALGYDLTQTLFVGKHALIVEGPADLVYLTVLSQRLARAGRQHLDPRWTITPARGADRIAMFVALLGAQKLNIAVLTDTSPKQRRENEEMRRRNADLLKQGRILSVGTYTGTAEADIEDLLGAELYCHLVNAAYGLKDAQRLTLPVNGRVVPHVEAYMRVLPPPVREYDHYGPAEHLARTPQLLDGAPGITEAERRFEALFRDIAPFIRA
jgi:predicted ATPase